MRELYIKAAPPGSMLARAEDRAGITAGPDKFFEAVLVEIELRLAAQHGGATPPGGYLKNFGRVPS